MRPRPDPRPTRARRGGRSGGDVVRPRGAPGPGDVARREPVVERRGSRIAAMDAAGPPPSAPSIASTHREASAFLVWGGVIILLAHGVELAHAGRPNWPALGIRVAWLGLLLGQAAVLRRATTQRAVLAGTAAAIFGSAALDLAILAA